MLLLELQWYRSTKNALLLVASLKLLKIYLIRILKLLRYVLKEVNCREDIMMLWQLYITLQSIWKKINMSQRSKLSVKTSENINFPPNNFFIVHITYNNPQWFKWMSDLQIFLTKGLVT